jgi:transposase InsO family protein
VKRLQDLSDCNRPDLRDFGRRGFAGQRRQREREHFLRSHIVTFQEALGDLGTSRAETAELLNLSPRTLRHWQQDAHRDGFAVLGEHALGRPCQRSSRTQRNEVIALLDELGPALGVPGLRDSFPGMARAELADLLRRYRRVWRLRHRQPLHILHWQVPGVVWAADFAEAPQPIDGLYPYLLAVRDLASGRQLLWLPTLQADSWQVVQALASLVAHFGSPLVLKTDNGSPFCAALTRAFLHQAGILPLFSPAYTPSYNGSAEAGIGSLKSRTEAHAARADHPNYWTFDDVAFAQTEANATARPQGPSGPTPDEIWDQRQPIAPAQRSLFQAAVDRHRDLLRSQEELPEVGPLTEPQERALDRQAIRRALEEHGFLLYSRRRIPLPFTKKKVAKIT